MPGQLAVSISCNGNEIRKDLYYDVIIMSSKAF